MQHTTMFAHDDTTIYYPTAPGRVFSITFTSLSNCDGSDENYEDATALGDVAGMVYFATKGVGETRRLLPTNLANPVPPDGWSAHGFDDDFADAVEMWADYCDRQSVRLDSLDEIKSSIFRAA